MSYHVYTTEGWILKGTAIGEADKYYHILTRDLGVVIARAKSVRTGVSKLSPSLLDFSFSNLSFVKGKHSWRLVGAVSIENTYKSLRDYPSKQILWVRFLDTLRKLIHGEEKDNVPFEIAKEFHKSLIDAEYSDDKLKSLECLAMLYLLQALGYLEEKDSFKDIVSSPYFHPLSVELSTSIRKELVTELNKALLAGLH